MNSIEICNYIASVDNHRKFNNVHQLRSVGVRGARRAVAVRWERAWPLCYATDTLSCVG